MKIILHHLGLGDHIVCNGLIRNYLKNKEKHLSVVKNRNIESVKFMFSDLNNLNYLQVDDNVNVRQFINNTFSSDLIKIGFQENERLTNLGYTWDEAFYLQMNVDFNKRWDDFYIPRKINEEKRFILVKNFNEHTGLPYYESKRRICILSSYGEELWKENLLFMMIF